MTSSAIGGDDFNLGWYFSSTQYSTGAIQVWGVSFINGLAKNIKKYNAYNVRAVRAF